MDGLKDITDGLKKNGRDRYSQYEQRPDHESRNGIERSESDARASGDEHVCAFCRTGFDATRGSCPDCGAEIVLRGHR